MSFKSTCNKLDWDGAPYFTQNQLGSVPNITLYDQETGLHYNWNRYYDPNTGRYTTSDPIGLWGGKNFYAYVRNNPLRWVDSFGLIDCTSIILEAWSRDREVVENIPVYVWRFIPGLELTGQGSFGSALDIHAPSRVPISPEIQVRFIIQTNTLMRVKKYDVTEIWNKLAVTCKWKETGSCGKEIERSSFIVTKKKIDEYKHIASDNLIIVPEVWFRTPAFGIPLPE